MTEQNIYDDCNFKNKENAHAWHTWTMNMLSEKHQTAFEKWHEGLDWGTPITDIVTQNNLFPMLNEPSDNCTGDLILP